MNQELTPIVLNAVNYYNVPLFSTKNFPGNQLSPISISISHNIPWIIRVCCYRHLLSRFPEVHGKIDRFRVIIYINKINFFILDRLIFLCDHNAKGKNKNIWVNVIYSNWHFPHWYIYAIDFRWILLVCREHLR